MSAKDLVSKTGSKHEKYMMIFLMWLGVFMIIAVLFKPFLSYFSTNSEKITIEINDLYFLGGGFVLSVGNRSLGTFVNNIIILLKLRLGLTDKTQNDAS